MCFPLTHVCKICLKEVDVEEACRGDCFTQRCQVNYVSDTYCEIHAREAVDLDQFNFGPIVEYLNTPVKEDYSGDAFDVDMLPATVPQLHSALDYEAYANSDILADQALYLHHYVEQEPHVEEAPFAGETPYAEDVMEFEVTCVADTEVNSKVTVREWVAEIADGTPYAEDFSLSPLDWAELTQAAVEAGFELDAPEAKSLEFDDVLGPFTV